MEANCCSIRVKKLVSLSIPVTYALKKLELLNDPALKFVSTPFGLASWKTSAESINGGIFLSNQYLEKFEGASVFFDQSRDLRRFLKRGPELNIFEVKSRGLDPFSMSDKILQQLSSVLVKCDKKINGLKQWLKLSLKKIKNHQKTDEKLIFFLGKVKKSSRLPNMIMNRDGFVLALINNLGIESYPSELSYLSPSQKILGKLSKSGKVTYVGLVGHNDKKGKLFEKGSLNKQTSFINFYAPKALVPGITQVEFLLSMLDVLFKG
jgi:hypothetical protein